MSHIDDVLNDPAASDWLKSALKSALVRDPVKAANDAEVLAQVLGERADQILRELANRELNDATKLENGNGG